MNEDAKNEIVEFLTSQNPDPDVAARLVLKHHTNQSEVRVFSTSPARYIMQMRWALAKAIGISLADFQRGYFTEARKMQTTDLPPVILRIKEELPILFNQRAELQKELVELGDGNEEETVEMAAQLGEIIAVLATRHQLLHEAKELYFESNGNIIPNEEELFPEGAPLGGGEKPKVNVLESGDPVEIMKRRDNLISSLTKDRNLLQYQSKSARDKEENPMPQGPERDKIEARIKEKEEEMEAINQYLADLKNSTEQPA
ncbi:MAG: hypothetical protein ACWA6U_07960 [Breznakibacter sp.]